MDLLLQVPSSLFFFNDTATTEIYTLSLHDALPIYDIARAALDFFRHFHAAGRPHEAESREEESKFISFHNGRSEEHTSELQSLAYLVCRLLLEKKKIFVSGWYNRASPPACVSIITE